jgi:hypothetical protein
MTVKCARQQLEGGLDFAGNEIRHGGARGWKAEDSAHQVLAATWLASVIGEEDTCCAIVLGLL